MDVSKRQIMDTFEKVKLGKLDASVLAAEYGIDASKFQSNPSMYRSSVQTASYGNVNNSTGMKRPISSKLISKKSDNFPRKESHKDTKSNSSSTMLI